MQQLLGHNPNAKYYGRLCSIMQGSQCDNPFPIDSKQHREWTVAYLQAQAEKLSKERGYPVDYYLKIYGLI